MMNFEIAEVDQIEIDNNVGYLKRSTESTPGKDIRELWNKTFNARNEIFLENKKLDKLQHYLSFKCIKSEYGLTLVS